MIKISAEQWALAALIGEARRRSNEHRRNASRDRGRDKNILNDLMGSIGELVAIKWFSQYLSKNEKINSLQNMFSLGGGSKHSYADLYLDNHPGQLSVDVKTFDCSPNKRFFAINQKKHMKLLGHCDGYACLLLPRLSHQAVFIPFVPYNDVSKWELRSLGGYGDPSYNIPISKFIKMYSSEQITLNELQAFSRYKESDIKNKLSNYETTRKFLSLCPEAAFLLIKH
ncbi:hypothetical protein NDJ00_20430 [Vibrio parahaemolyticus]|uniref:hypothetical protein n=1 Tax=Vibrio parahaemolyticus TaxID=670 RepID=UPI0021608A2E|nr:hypothetical protein [Vibrio parahaemolyticus]MCS0116539.1 hypothetical protein [Vibrio parahaemolyticus]